MADPGNGGPEPICKLLTVLPFHMCILLSSHTISPVNICEVLITQQNKLCNCNHVVAVHV